MEDKYKKIWEEAEETFLEILQLSAQKQKELEKIGDVAGKELLEKEVISKYESLYLALQSENFDTFSEEQWKAMEDILEEIQKKHQISREYLGEKRRLRKHLTGKSGAEVVKKLWEYQKKELEKQKRLIFEEASQVLEEEEILHRKLCEAIQEEEQLRLFELMQPLQQKYRKISEKAIDIQKKIDYTVRDIEKKWKFEIYGTISEQTLKETSEEFFKKQKN
ncbi:hypothetical protein EPT53_05735 [Fusobacterium necrophorum]|uniref:Uncharacterized protein n=1 Tax=Fusobacterium necrophorum TaxID=859 RepID=A0A4Q2KYW0_9FUSO|nr:hypothetical protein [Fusobacterium necrophorum]RXZ69790.1 hypothetical protein EPT53_05735 [Fusobacterium necrophorum]